MRLTILSVLLIQFAMQSQGQQPLLDSLKRAVDQYSGKHDTSYVLLRNSLTVQKIYHDPSDTTQVEFIEETLRISQKLNFPKGIMLSYQRLGTVYQFFLGDPLLAIEYYQKALEVIDENPKLRIHTPNCQANIASIYFDQKEYRKALSLYKEIDAEFSENTIMAQYIANVYGAMEQYDSAIYYFKETIKKASLLNNIIVKAYAHNALAMMLTKNGQLTEAIPNIEESLRLVDAHQLELVRPSAYTNASEIYLAQKQYDNAETYANLALELANKINNLSMAVSAYATLQGIYEAKGDYKKSLEAYKQYTALNDSISNAVTKRISK